MVSVCSVGALGKFLTKIMMPARILHLAASCGVFPWKSALGKQVSMVAWEHDRRTYDRVYKKCIGVPYKDTNKTEPSQLVEQQSVEIQTNKRAPLMPLVHQRWGLNIMQRNVHSELRVIGIPSRDLCTHAGVAHLDNSTPVTIRPLCVMFIPRRLHSIKKPTNPSSGLPRLKKLNVPQSKPWQSFPECNKPEICAPETREPRADEVYEKTHGPRKVKPLPQVFPVRPRQKKKF